MVNVVGFESKDKAQLDVIDRIPRIYVLIYLLFLLLLINKGSSLGRHEVSFPLALNNLPKMTK